MAKLLSFFTRGRVYFLLAGLLLLFALFFGNSFFGGAAPEAAPASAESCQPATHEAVPFAWMRHDVPLLVRYSPIFFLLIVGNLALKQMYLLWRGCTGRQRRSAWLLLLSFAVAGVGFFFTARKVGMLPPSFAPPPPAECQPASKPLSFFR